MVGPGGAVNLGQGAGIAEEGITIERSEDKSTMVIGADGHPMHSLHAGSPGTVMIRVQKTSPTNAVLAAMYNLQRLSSVTWGLNTITVSNPVTGDIITCRMAAFKRHANLTFAKEGGMNEWQLDVGIIDTILGGTAP